MVVLWPQFLDKSSLSMSLLAQKFLYCKSASNLGQFIEKIWKRYLGGAFKDVCHFHPKSCKDDPFGPIFFIWVETTT